MSPSTAKRLQEKGIDLLTSRKKILPQSHGCYPVARSDKAEPRPIIEVSEEYIQQQLIGFLSRLPGVKLSYSFPEISKAHERSTNWARTRFARMEGLIDKGNGMKQYLEVPREMLIADFRTMIVRKKR